MRLFLLLFLLGGLQAQQIRIPGIGGIAPSSSPIPALNLKGWYDAGLGANCGGACTNGASQTTWADQSGLGNNGSFAASSCAAGTAPIYNTAQINGLPAVTFTRITVGCFLLSSPINLQTASTIFAVVKLTSTSGISPVFGGPTNSYVMDMARSSEQGGTKSNTAVLGAGSTAAGTAYHQINQTYNGTTITFRLDRAADGSASPSVAITANSTTIGRDVGSADLFGGQMAELIIYDRVLTGPEITQVENYLFGKYGL